MTVAARTTEAYDNKLAVSRTEEEKEVYPGVGRASQSHSCRHGGGCKDEQGRLGSKRSVARALGEHGVGSPGLARMHSKAKGLQGRHINNQSNF